MRRVAILALVGCGSQSVTADRSTSAPKAIFDAGMTVVAPAETDASAPVVSEAKPAIPVDPPGAWLTRPPKKADFYVALDGICRYLRVDTAGNDAFAITTTVPYILTPNVAILARLVPEGLADMSKGAGPVTSVVGHYPDALLAMHSGTERIYIGSEVMQWKDTEWIRLFKNPYEDDQKALRREFELPVAWKGGFVSISKWTNPDVNFMQASPSTSGTDLIASGVPQSALKPLSKPGFTPRRLVARPSGELFVMGTTPLVRWLDVAGAVHEYTVKAATADLDGWSQAEVHIISEGKTIARFDGTSFTTADLPTDPPPKLTPPKPDAVVAGKKWAYTKKGEVWARDGESWTPKTLPPPVFGTSTARTISDFAVLPSGEAIFVVGYYEKGRGWKDPVLYHALVRSERPAETLRCNEPDPENLVVSSGHGYTSWPPLADDACTTPFVILGRKSNAHPPPVKDWPAIRRAMKGKQAELGGSVDLLEVRGGDRIYVGAATKTFAEARTLLDTVAKATPTRGEITCAVPTAISTFHVDVASGETR